MLRLTCPSVPFGARGWRDHSMRSLWRAFTRACTDRDAMHSARFVLMDTDRHPDFGQNRAIENSGGSRRFENAQRTRGVRAARTRRESGASEAFRAGRTRACVYPAIACTCDYLAAVCAYASVPSPPLSRLRARATCACAPRVRPLRVHRACVRVRPARVRACACTCALCVRTHAPFVCACACVGCVCACACVRAHASCVCACACRLSDEQKRGPSTSSDS
eukprot:6180150-Pleurochrysis_carterae.AAC.1